VKKQIALCLGLYSEDLWWIWKRSQRYSCPRADHLSWTELGRLYENKSFIYISLYVLYILRPMVVPASSEDGNPLSFSFILRKSCYFSLQIALSVATLCWVCTTMHIPWYIIFLWLPLSVQLLYLFSCHFVIEKDCHCSHYKVRKLW